MGCKAHAARPCLNPRVLLPAKSDAVSAFPEKVSATRGIPLVLHYTSKSEAGLPSWESLNPGLRIQYHSDHDLNTLFQDRFPDLKDAFKSMVEKADFYRYWVLYELGGFYSDIDVKCIKPINQWIATFPSLPPGVSLQNIDFIFGFEFVQSHKHSQAVNGLPFQILQWTFASSAGNPILLHVLDVVKHRITTVPWVNDDSTEVRTGPDAWTFGIMDFLNSHTDKPGDPTNLNYPSVLLPLAELDKTGQVISFIMPDTGTVWRGLMLPYRAFGFHSMHEALGLLGHNKLQDHLVEHQFSGNWRQNG